MSTSLLYHTLGLKGYTLKRTDYVGSLVRFHLEAQRSQMVCPVCGSRHVIRKGSVPREFKATCLGIKGVRLCAKVPRVLCKQCGCLRQIARNHLGYGQADFEEPSAQAVPAPRFAQPAKDCH